MKKEKALKNFVFKLDIGKDKADVYVEYRTKDERIVHSGTIKLEAKEMEEQNWVAKIWPTIKKFAYDLDDAVREGKEKKLIHTMRVGIKEFFASELN